MLVVEVAFTAAVVAAVSTAAGATAEEAVTIARLAAAAMVAVIAGATVEAIAAAITAAIIIPCRPAAPIPRDVPAILTIHPRTADTPQAIAATIPRAAAIRIHRVTA